MKFSRERGYINRESYVAQYLALAIFITGVVSTVGSDDLLAAFAAGSYTFPIVPRHILTNDNRQCNFMGWRIQYAYRRGIFCHCHRPPPELWLLRLHRCLATFQVIHNAWARNHSMETNDPHWRNPVSATYPCDLGTVQVDSGDRFMARSSILRAFW